MAGKAINQYNEYTGQPSGVNILVQEQSQSDPNTFEHKKADLDSMLNKKIVQTIADGDTTHAPSADAVHAMKTGLDGDISAEATARENAVNAEATARQSADHDLQTQIANTNKAVENLDAIIEGEEKIVNTDPAEGQSIMAQSRLIHHVNLLPNGKFGRVGARGVPFNQLLPTATLNFSNKGLTVTSSNDGTINISGTTNAQGAFDIISNCGSTIAGHKYVLALSLKVNSGSSPSGTTFGFRWGDGMVGNTWCYGDTLLTGNLNKIGTEDFMFNSYAVGVSVNVTIKPMFFDLTIMDMASLTADQFRAKFPDSYYPPTTGHIYDLNPSGFRIRGINLWDEEWEYGYIDNNGGLSDATDRIRSKNFMPVSSGKEYYIHKPNIQTFYLRYYDADKNFIGYRNDGTTSFVAPQNCVYIKFHYWTDTYHNNLQIADDSLPTAVKQTYHPYEGRTADTPQIADGHGVNDTVYDYVENVVEEGHVKGKHHKRVASYTFDGTESWNKSSYYYKIAKFNTLIKRPNSNADIPNVRCSDKHIPVNWTQGLADYCVYVAPTTATESYVVWFKNVDGMSAQEFASYMSGKTFYYEIAEEVVTDCEPLVGFTIPDYATVEPITPQDQLVNRIDVPFSVVTESDNGIIERINANTQNIATETATRSAQVSALNKRVTNIELKTGDTLPVTYPSDDYGADSVPPSVEPYAKVKTLTAKSRVWNQLITNGDFSDGDSEWSDNTLGLSTHTVSDGIYKQTFIATPQNDFGSGLIDNGQVIPVIQGHDYLIACLFRSSKATTVRGYLASIGYFENVSVPANTWVLYAKIKNAPSSNADATFFINNADARIFNVGDTNEYSKIIVRDLSTIFSELNNTQIETLDVNGLLTICPDLLTYDDFGYSLVDTVVEGVTASVPYDEWDGIMEDGYISISNGQNAGGTGYKRCASYVPVTPNTKYRMTFAPTGGILLFYGSDKSYLGYDNNMPASPNTVAEFVTGANVYYIRFWFNYNGSFTDPTVSDYTTLSLSTPFTGKSAGSVADTDELNEEVLVDGVKVNKRRQTEKIGHKALSDSSLTWSYMSATHILYAQFADAKQNSAFVTDLPYDHTNGGSGMVDVTCGFGSANNYFYVKNTSMTEAQLRAFVAEYSINYILATEVVTLLDPIEDNFIKVEPNGTVRTTQSQSPEIDSVMTVEYMAS